jgi:UDP-glucose 4-epimerase
VLALEALPGGARGPLNLGRGVGVSVREVLASVARVTGRPVPVERAEPRPGDPASLVARIDAARTGLGWVPRVGSLDEIVRTAWVRQQRHAGSPRSSLG